MNFSEMIKTARAKLGLSYRKLSEQTGISHSHIRDIENGKHSPSFDNAVVLANALDINIKEVIISTYQSQLRGVLFDLIETCDKYEITIPYNEWIKSNLPIQPLGIEKTELHESAFKIAESLYSETNEQKLNKKLEFIDSISNSNYHSYVYSEVPELLEAINTTTQVQGIPKTNLMVSNFIKEVERENEKLLSRRGDSDEQYHN
ncbi:helix-turn-helix domain-containing protein [Virgibacillus dakarensis]|nr:helix-turn-helix domain-containing protein [Virgibacillus dakarensis]